ncbi:unnamed protein product [Porites evermanni]|uniref:C-type lectin domain-containing protein n=1 Tax=Porites evermanni TaxID=104178 RepID=A0ABN8SBY2_9CNID|nr:unnamed protein product [Porites evermanni]
MITLALLVSLLLTVTRRYSALECPETWKEFEGFCYKVMDRLGYRRRFAWSTAVSGCFGFGGDLVSISNEKEKKFVHDTAFKDANRTSVWIGLAYRHQKGGYVWTNGESFNISVSVQWLNMSRIVYENKCVEILKNGWNLTECCKENKHLFCKRPKGPLACSAGWFFNGVSCYKENGNGTWEGARQGCTDSGGDLVKVDDDNQKRFLIHFMEVTGLKKTNLDVSTVCYEYPNRNSSVPIKVSCTFPEDLCFKYDNTTSNGEQVTIRGCISADQCGQFDDHHLHCCEGDLCNSVKNTTISEPENPTQAISKVIYISLGITSAFLLLSVAIVVWCYRRKKLKTIERQPLLSLSWTKSYLSCQHDIKLCPVGEVAFLKGKGRFREAAFDL